MPQQRSEDSYIFNDILPFLASNYGYPIHDSERVKIKEVPIFRPSGGIAGAIDIVYYHNGEPILLMEAKRDYKSHEIALKEALYYLKNFPTDKSEYAPSEIPPKILATTVGSDIQFYKWSIDYSREIPNYRAEMIEILSFEKLLEYYSLIPEIKPRQLDVKTFKIDFFDQLTAIYILEEKITREVILDVTYQIFNFLKFGDKFTGQWPYTRLNLQRQKAVRDLFNRFDLIGSLNPEIADEYRSATLRAFQGLDLNQYMTHSSVINFMVNLVGIGENSKILDFECGSGGFLVAALKKGAGIENIKGIDIDELPYLVTKTYMAIYSGKYEDDLEQIERTIKKDNGLFYYGDNWDIVIGNPAGGSQYEHGNLEKILDGGLENLKDRPHTFSEYELSIQQAVRSAKVDGEICLILPEGFFSNSQDDFLRKYVAKYCKISAIVSLPRGVFKKGTETKGLRSGAATRHQKMSILYAKKIKEVVSGEDLDLNGDEINYSLFLASIDRPENLEAKLNFLLKQWNSWKNNGNLIKADDEEIKEIIKIELKKKKEAVNKNQVSLSTDTKKELKPKKEAKKSFTTKISENLKDLFK
jgi:predicted RNA methylase